MVQRKSTRFSLNACIKIRKWKYGENWPVVYIIQNKDEAYVGETTSAFVRFNTHLKDARRVNFKKIHVFTDSDFNKSVALDIESFLIKYMSADGKFKLQNGNGGMQSHNFYHKDQYRKKFDLIWSELRRLNLAKGEIRNIENSDIFKYSPYKSLTPDQYFVAKSILDDVIENIHSENSSISIVDGGAGTGKTVLGIYLMKLLADLKNRNPEFDDDSHMLIEGFEEVEKVDLKIGLVIPMKSLRKTIQKVFKKVKGLNSSMVISPNECVKDYYDLLIVDEAHRLRRRVNLPNFNAFDDNNQLLDLGDNGTELDWIIRSSKHQILFYDSNQTVKPTDVRPNRFLYDANKRSYNRYALASQLRCMGGSDYIEYVHQIFSSNPLTKKTDFGLYEFKLFDDVKVMTDNIRKLDKEHGLCRNVAGYSWSWVTRGKKREFDENGGFADRSIDILIDGHGYIWNTVSEDWINSSNSINEIGCIHTVQGYDLNYTGVIIGNELKYDGKTKRIFIDKSNYFDRNGRVTATEDELHEYIINIYTTLFTRGIKGTFVYACDSGLQDYLKKFITSEVISD
jgi:uncharacterized protein